MVQNAALNSCPDFPGSWTASYEVNKPFLLGLLLVMMFVTAMETLRLTPAQWFQEARDTRKVLVPGSLLSLSLAQKLREQLEITQGWAK